MRFFIIIFILCWCFSSEHEIVAQAAAPADSIIAPNVFSPNGDGINDVFEVTSRNGNKVSLKIYTRTNILVFSIEALRCRWDGYSISGEDLPNGVYYYTAETVDASPKVAKAGFIHLYR